MKLKELSVEKLQSETVYIWCKDDIRKVKPHSNEPEYYSVGEWITSYKNLTIYYGNCPVKLKSEVEEFMIGDLK